MKEIEQYYSVRLAAERLGLHERTVVIKLKARAFGNGVVNLSSTAAPDYRIPASGLNAFLNARRIFLPDCNAQSEPKPELPIAARTIGELRRKAAAS